MRKSVLFTVLLLCISPAIAANWTQVSTPVDDQVSVYVDVSSIERIGFLARAKVKAVYKTGTLAAYQEDNCQTGEFTLRGKQQYSASGKLIEITESGKIWVPAKVAAEGAEKIIHDYICFAAGIPITKQASPEKDSVWGQETPEKRLTKIGKKILASVGITEIIIFGITRKDDDVNAYSSEAYRTVLLTEPLLNYVDNDDEAAGVIAHEIAHIVLNHTSEKEQHLAAYAQELNAQLDRQRRTSVTTTSVLAGLVGGFTGRGAIPAAIQAGVSANDDLKVQQAHYLKLYLEEYKRTRFTEFSQAKEYEADRYAVDLMKKAGYNPTAFPAILRKIASDSALQWRTHPATSNRIARINEILRTSQ